MTTNPNESGPDEPDNSILNHIPAGATVITPAAGQPTQIAAGHIAQTGADVVMLTIRDNDHNPICVALTPAMAADIGHHLIDKATKLGRPR
ncbi:hypothetical protein JDV09_21075 [Mycobacterium sp. Y57]|uniref:hypothetical protein n=1 Tax=Mycolicibacterium xanthum TaxID=2796469 RepID=UPI001C84B912|nr:hypothetical protein [Mycolicibacterium xanthum]MBX7434570.1 hypothetical protein [Mycolicibacterium xanthum]